MYIIYRLYMYIIYIYIYILKSCGTSMFTVKLADQTAELHTHQPYSQSQLK